MYARVRDILATNYLEQLGISPSAHFREIRRTIGRIEMEAEMGAASVDGRVIEKAKVALATEERVLEYRVLARWSGDDVLGPWSARHDAAVEQLRAAARGGPQDAAAAVAAWLEAHTDAAVDAALGAAARAASPLQWVGDVAEDYLSAALVPGGAVMTAAQLRGLDLRRFPKTRAGLWSKLVSCRHAEAGALEEELPDPDVIPAPPLHRLAAWFRRTKDLLVEVRAIQDALRELDQEEGGLPLDLFSARESLGDAAASAALALGALLFRRDAYRTTIELLQLASSVDCRSARKDDVRKSLELVAQHARRARTADRSGELDRSEPPARPVIRPAPRPAAPEPGGRGRAPAAPSFAERLRRLNWGAIVGWLFFLGLIGGGIAAVLIESSTEDERSRTGSSSGASFTPAVSSPRFRVGQCVIWNEVEGSLTPASCMSSRARMILAMFQMSGISYPTEAQFDRAADANCPITTDSFVYPTKSGWVFGDREVICLGP